MRIGLIALGIITLIALAIGLWFLLSPKEESVGYIRFPQAGDRTITSDGDGIAYPDRGPGYEDVVFEPEPEPTRPSSNDSTDDSLARSFGQSFAAFFARLVGNRPTGTVGQTPGSAVAENPGDVGVSFSGGGSIPFISRGDGGSYSGPSPYYQYPDTDAGSEDDNGDLRDDVEFDPQTGDLWVAGVHFNFTGMQTVANNTTSDVVGDPDNLTLGTTIGSFVGALIGDPALGLLLGTALGSNLYNGFTLEDLGIGLDNGMPTFGGMNPLEEGGMFDGGADESSEEADSQGEGYFGGYAFAMNCTCPDTSSNYFFMVLSPEDYAGTYLMTPESKAYEEYGTVGFFSVLGSYDQGSSGDCELYVVEECIPVEIDKGTINAMPGYGTSGFGD